MAFTASTSSLYAQDLKHVRINSISSEKAIYKEVEFIRSLIEEQKFDYQRSSGYQRMGTEEYNHLMQSQKFKKNTIGE